MKFYAHSQATGSSITLNLGSILPRIDTDNVKLSLKELTVVLSSAGGTANTPLSIVANIQLPTLYSAINQSRYGGSPIILHTVGVAGSSTRVCVYHVTDTTPAELVVPMDILKQNGSQLVLSYNNQSVYGDSTTVTVSYLEAVLELSTAD